MKKAIFLIISIFILNACSDDEEVQQDGLPSVTTSPITNILTNTITGGGNVTNEGRSVVTAKGVCWSISTNPTISDSKTTDGIGIGNYISLIFNLNDNTTYYLRAYATNDEGTSYGSEELFTTLEDTTHSFLGEIVSVDGGTFIMGSNNGNSNEQPTHSVTVDSFIIGKLEITNTQYALFMNDLGVNSDGSYEGVDYIYVVNNAIKYDNGLFVVKNGKENYPVVKVSWYGANAYCNYYGGRLPTAAEWEFAAIGGNNSNGYIFSGSNTIDNVAWYIDNFDNHLHNVGTKNPNEIGLFDMSGNVYEWCSDWYSSNYYSSSPSNNPQGPSSGNKKVGRGGGLISEPFNCRVSYRSNGYPDLTTYGDLGFRITFNQ